MLFKVITRLLVAEEWPLIDLTLGQFKLVNNWEGNVQSYVVRMVEDADDEVLLELASHLAIDSTPRPPDIAQTIKSSPVDPAGHEA